MIVNVSMCASMFDETLHVMKFSAIAKKVSETQQEQCEFSRFLGKLSTAALNAGPIFLRVVNCFLTIVARRPKENL